MTVHQIIITYDTSKYDNLRRNSNGRNNAYEEENDEQQNKQEHKLEVNILWIPNTYISMNLSSNQWFHICNIMQHFYLKSVQKEWTFWYRTLMQWWMRFISLWILYK